MTADGPREPAPLRGLTAGVIVLLTLIGYFKFPGHTFLNSDTQIYIPILERFWDQGVLSRDMVAIEPHVSFTIYDEAALALRRAAGLGFAEMMAAQQFLYRALGLLGVFLLATALGLRQRPALLVTALFSLGATVVGPSVLTIEYEPVPRGFAVPLLLLAVGLASHGRDLGAGIAAAVAFLYHPPTVLPFWAVYFALTLWPSKPALMKRRILGLLPILAGVLVLFAMSRLQTGAGDPQGFFGRIAPELESVQRLRAPYNWISTWETRWVVQYIVLWLISLAAVWRIRKSASQDVRFFLIGLPLAGMLAMPLSWVLLERMKWIVVPQAQPARAVLFVIVMAVILAAVAAVKAKRWWESVVWLLPVLAPPLNVLDLPNPLIGRRALVMVALAALGAFAIWAQRREKKWSPLAWGVALVLPFLAIPAAGGVRNYVVADTPQIREVAAWARANTAADAVFLFPDARKELHPGIFRARALRAVYVDWKGGGQVNFLRRFAREWWSRWVETGQGRFRPADAAKYPRLGIDYFVVKLANRPAGRAAVFENGSYAVFATR